MFTSWGSFDGDGNAAAEHHSAHGFLLGADAAIGDHARIGVLGGYGDAEVTFATAGIRGAVHRALGGSTIGLRGRAA